MSNPRKLQIPDTKVQVGGAALALMSLVAWAVEVFTDQVVPAPQVMMGATVITFALQYLVPNK